MIQAAKPLAIRLEAATVCQLRCPTCPTTDGKIRKNLGTGFLKFDDFKRFIDENPWVFDVELSNWGEIFLSPDLLKMMEYAYRSGVALRADNGVNLNTASDSILEGLVRYRFRSLRCSIDGASPETYRIYRQRGDFDTVLNNIKKINQFKAQHNSRYPELTWQFVAFGHNEHEIPKAQRLAKELHMRFSLKLSWDETFSPIKNPEAIRETTGLGVASRSEYHQKYGSNYLQKQTCAQLWNHPQINWDGRVLGCCVNYWGDFGNAFEEGLLETLNGEKMEYARQMLQGRSPARADIPCNTCPHYLTMQKTGVWLTQEDITRGHDESAI